MRILGIATISALLMGCEPPVDTRPEIIGPNAPPRDLAPDRDGLHPGVRPDIEGSPALADMDGPYDLHWDRVGGNCNFELTKPKGMLVHRGDGHVVFLYADGCGEPETVESWFGLQTVETGEYKRANCAGDDAERYEPSLWEFDYEQATLKSEVNTHRLGASGPCQTIWTVKAE